MRELFIFVGFILIFLNPIYSQNSEKRFSNEGSNQKAVFKLEPAYKKNLIKVDPGKLLLGGINLSYERVLTPKTSINFRAKFHPLGFVERSIDGFSISGADYTFKLTDKPLFQHIGFDTEYRFYINNRNNASGFYVAPYLHYLGYSGRFRSNYTSKIGDMPVDIVGNLKTTMDIWGVGAQIGVQWRINDRISIDWGFAGLGVDRYVFGVDVMSENIANVVNEYSDDLQDVLGGASGFLSRKLSFYILDNELSSSVPFWMVGWKSFLTVGIAF